MVKPGKTFREAAESYLVEGGDARYMDKVIEYFGDTLLTDIFPYNVRKMAEILYPNHMASTKNRHALTPVRSVLNHGYDRGWCHPIRIKAFKQLEPSTRNKEPASLIWLYMFLRECDKGNLPHLAAIVLFMNQTAARISEAVRLEWKDVDLLNRKVMLQKTKTGVNSERFLTDELVTRLTAMKQTQDLTIPVFKYTSRFSVAERVWHVCIRAGISYKSPHLLGRHSFATNAIKLGVDVKTAMEAGGWKSSKVFLETYVHGRDSGRNVAERLNQYRFNTD